MHELWFDVRFPGILVYLVSYFIQWKLVQNFFMAIGQVSVCVIPTRGVIHWPPLFFLC